MNLVIQNRTPDTLTVPIGPSDTHSGFSTSAAAHVAEMLWELALSYVWNTSNATRATTAVVRIFVIATYLLEPVELAL